MGVREQRLPARSVVERLRVPAIVALQAARFRDLARDAAVGWARIVDVRRTRAMTALATDTGALVEIAQARGALVEAGDVAADALESVCRPSTPRSRRRG